MMMNDEETAAYQLHDGTDNGVMNTAIGTGGAAVAPSSPSTLTTRTRSASGDEEGGVMAMEEADIDIPMRTNANSPNRTIPISTGSTTAGSVGIHSSTNSNSNSNNHYTTNYTAFDMSPKETPISSMQNHPYPNNNHNNNPLQSNPGGNPNNPNNTNKRKGTSSSSGAAAAATALTTKSKEVVVIVKSYYLSHSLRVPALLSSPKPTELETLSNTTWFEIQAQLEPLIKRHLFLPKSYLFVPLLCIFASVGWFVCFSIAAAEAANSQKAAQQQQQDNQYNNYNHNNQNQNGDDAAAAEEQNDDQYAAYDDQYNNNGGGGDDQYGGNANDNYQNQQQQALSDVTVPTVSMVFWVGLFFVLLTFVWLAFSRWVAKRNHPVDDELREVCLELSRSKTQAEGYRLEYHKANFDAQDPFRNDLFCTRVLRFVPLPIPRKITVPSGSSRTAGQFVFTDHHATAGCDSMSVSTESSEFPTLQSLSTTDFSPFPATDRILENLVSLLFVLVIFQCVNSLP